MTLIISIIFVYLSICGVNATGCSDPTPQNGYASFGIGDWSVIFAHIYCNDGYTLLDENYRIIECRHGMWSGIPACVQVTDCGDPPYFQVNGITLQYRLEFGHRRHGDIVYYLCPSGYVMLGTHIGTCEQGGWSVVQPICTRDCGDPPYFDVDGMTLTYTLRYGHRQEGDIVIYNCPDGYIMMSNNIAVCEKDGWSDDKPSCERSTICGKPPEFEVDGKPLTSTLQYGNSLEGDFANYDCPVGYVMSGNAESQCLEGGWSEVNPVCLIDCGAVPDISNGTVTLPDGASATVGAVANVACNSGFLPTSNTAKCLHSGNWEHVQCEIIICAELENLVNGTINTSDGTKIGSVATYACDEGFTIVGDTTRVCLQNGKWSNMKPDCLLEGVFMRLRPTNAEEEYQTGANICTIDTDVRGTVWNEIAAGRNRTIACDSKFNGTVIRQCGKDGVWKLPEYLCTRKSVSNVIRKIDLLNVELAQQGVLNGLQELKNVTKQAENTDEKDKLTDLEVRSLLTSTGKVTNLLSDSPITNNEVANECTEIINNLIDGQNTESWKAITQTNNTMAEEMLRIVDTLINAMAKIVTSLDKEFQPIVKPNIALHVRVMTSDNFVFPGPETVQGTSSDSWFRETRSQINFQSGSLEDVSFVTRSSKKYVAKVAIFRDISNIMPDKSDDEQLNGQILSFSTLPPLTGTLDPPIAMSFEQTNTMLTKGTCSFWKFDESGGNGFWSTEGCTATSTSEGFTQCACNHTTNFALILSLQDCGNLENPTNGSVVTSDGTTFPMEAIYSCNQGYSLNGTITRFCTSTGYWSSSAPTCIQIEEEKAIVKCLSDIDSRGITWPETVSGNTNEKRCQEGFTGLISRTCGSDGVWKLPLYNCIRRPIVEINEKVSDFNENATQEEIDEVLTDIVEVTSINETAENNETLTDGELSILTASLESIASILETASDIVNEIITEEFLESVSNLVDDSNQDSWQSLSQSDSGDSEKLLKAVDSLATVLSSTIKAGSENNGTFIVKKNIAMEVKKVSNKDVIFPDPNSTIPDKTDESANWFKESSSSLRLDANSLINASVEYITTSVIYRDLSKILPNKRENDTSETSEDSDYSLNAPILSLTISPPVTFKLDPPLRLTFTHNQINYTDPACVYWVFAKDTIGKGFWSSEGCFVNSANTNYTVCECDHLTNFAVLMSPFVEADATSKALRIISMVGIGVSIACLVVTLVVHISLWSQTPERLLEWQKLQVRYLRNDRTTALLNLCVALLFSYILFLAGVDRTESGVACAVIAAVLQYIYLVVFCIMLVEGIQIAITVLYVFKTNSRTKVMLLFAWVIPAIIVGISLGATQANGYGNDNYCWLSVDNGLIWAFVGPALFVMTFNVICLLIVIRVMFKTKAMKMKTVLEKIQTSFRSLCVLVPLMGVSWILGFFYMSESFYFIQYIFAILNGLQGFFIFLFHCIFNEQVKAAIRLIKRRRSSLNETFLNSSREERKSKDMKEIRASVVGSGKSAKVDGGYAEYEEIVPRDSKPVQKQSSRDNHQNGRRMAIAAK